MTFRGFVNIVNEAYDNAESEEMLDEPIMVTDVTSGELYGFKSLKFDPDNDCWVICMEE